MLIATHQFTVNNKVNFKHLEMCAQHMLVVALNKNKVFAFNPCCQS